MGFAGNLWKGHVVGSSSGLKTITHIGSGSVAWHDLPAALLAGDISSNLAIWSHRGFHMVFDPNFVDSAAETTELELRQVIGPEETAAVILHTFTNASFAARQVHIPSSGVFNLRVLVAPSLGKSGHFKVHAL